MIGNPVVVQQGGGSKVYSITDNSRVGFPASAEAGQIVYVYDAPKANNLSVVDSDGNSIPFSSTGTFMVTYCFVMPASDVTITNPVTPI